MKRFPGYTFSTLMAEDSRFLRLINVYDYAHAATYDLEAVDDG